jgi:hypothetical protein
MKVILTLPCFVSGTELWLLGLAGGDCQDGKPFAPNRHVTGSMSWQAPEKAREAINA